MQPSHRSPHKCLTDVQLAGKHLSCLFREKKKKATHHSLSSTFEENKRTCIDKPRMRTPWEMSISAIKEEKKKNPSQQEWNPEEQWASSYKSARQVAEFQKASEIVYYVLNWNVIDHNRKVNTSRTQGICFRHGLEVELRWMTPIPLVPACDLFRL